PRRSASECSVDEPTARGPHGVRSHRLFAVHVGYRGRAWPRGRLALRTRPGARVPECEVQLRGRSQSVQPRCTRLLSILGPHQKLYGNRCSAGRLRHIDQGNRNRTFGPTPYRTVGDLHVMSYDETRGRSTAVAVIVICMVFAQDIKESST